MSLASDFGYLFILDARDKASETFAKADESLTKFTGTAKAAADSATAAGAAIDESLLQTASGADALDVANARVEGAQARVASAAQAQAAAERELLAAQQAAATAADGDAAANERLAVAAKGLSEAQKTAAVETKALRDAQASQVGVLKAAAKAGDEQAAAQLKAKGINEESSRGLSGLTKAAGLMTLGMAAVGYESVKMAGNFQDSTTHLVTDAGESAKNLAMVQAGILRVSSATGTSATDITNAMYHIESGGLHGQAGLKVLTIAAEGAKVGGADLDTVSKTLVGTMNAYYGSTLNAGNATHLSAQMMNELVATVGAGDMKMQDLASSLSNVAPLAAAVGLKFSQVGGAIATMTAQGMSADQATQDLANTIRSLSKPNNVAIAEMNQFGINANDVQTKLGQRGLTGTLQYLTQMITAKIPRGGAAIMSAFTQSATASQDLQIMLSKMPPQFAKLADGYMKGAYSAKQWQQEIQGQTGSNKALLEQFAGLYNKSQSFNAVLAKGGPAAKTYTTALANMMGGATGLNTALMLSGNNAGVFAQNVSKIQAAADKSGTSVNDWSTIQGTFNQKMASAKTAVENTGIALGSALLPAVTSMLQKVSAVLIPIATWTEKHKTLTKVVFGAVGGVAALVAAVGLLHKAYSSVTGAINTVKAGLQKIGVLSKSAAAATDGLTASEEANAAATDASAEAADVSSSSWVANGLAAAGAAVKTGVLKVAQLAGAAASYVAAGAATALGAAIDFATGPIGLIIIAIVALVAIFVVLWSKCAWFRNFWKGLWHDIESAAKAVWNALKTAFNDVARAFSAVFHLIAAVAKAEWDITVAAFRAAGDVIKTVMGAIRTAIEAAWHFIVSVFEVEIGLIKTAVSWFVSLPGKFMGWMRDVGSAVSKGVGDVVRFFTALPGKIVSGIGSVGSLLLQKGKDIVNGLWSGIKNIWGTVTSFFTGLGKTVEGWLSDAGTWLVDAGKHVIGGLWSGIKSAAGGLKNDVKSVAGTVTGWFTSGFGILSPSRVMREKVGKFIPPGIALGITDNLGVLKKAAGLAANVTVSAAQAGIGGAGSGVHIPAPVAAAGGGVVNLHFDLRGATVSNQQAARNLVNQIGGVVAKQMFAEGGYKLQTM